MSSLKAELSQMKDRYANLEEAYRNGEESYKELLLEIELERSNVKDDRK